MTDTPLSEWHSALGVAMHFNDLLMRLRGLGITAVVTIMGAAVAFGMSAQITDVPKLVIVGVLGTASIVGAVFTHRVEGWSEQARAGLGRIENLMLSSLVFVFVVGLVWYSWRTWQERQEGFYSDIPVALPITAFALSLLLTFYILDRFYYFRLLLGAITRLEEIERQGDESFRLTQAITEMTPRGLASAVVTLLYYIPALAGTIITLLLVRTQIQIIP